MKKRNINLILPVLVLVLYLSYIFISLIMSANAPQGPSTPLVIDAMMSMSIIVILGCCFTFSKNDGVLKKVGYSLLALIGVLILGAAIAEMMALNASQGQGQQPPAQDPLFGFTMVLAIIIILTPIQYFVLELLSYFNFVRVTDEKLTSKNEDNFNKVNELKKWNKLVVNNTISNEDYNLIKAFTIKQDEYSEEVVKLQEFRELIENKLANIEDLKESLIK